VSHNETATPTPRIRITPAESPAPPWTGKKFTCEKCTAEWQLEAADQCELRIVVNDHLHAYNTPPCPTPGCGHINVIEIRVDEPIQEANAS
jgi:hypothetical protein